MTENQLKNWITKFGEGWSKQKPGEVMKLFAQNLKYFETPVSEPITKWENVNKLWLVVPENQKDVEFSSQIISCTKLVGVVNWKVNRKYLPTNESQQIDGIFVIKLDSRGLCNYFKQWRFVKVS